MSTINTNEDISFYEVHKNFLENVDFSEDDQWNTNEYKEFFLKQIEQYNALPMVNTELQKSINTVKYTDTNGGKYDRQVKPSFSEMAKTFTTALVGEVVAIKNKQEKVSKEEKNRRLSICKNCDFFDQNINRCLKCGCFLKWKTAWRSQKCPIGKW